MTTDAVATKKDVMISPLSRRRMLGGTALATAVVAGMLASPAGAEAETTPRLIIDTDIFADVDDVGALAIANAAHQAGDVRLLAVVVNTPSRWGAPAASAINTYYGNSHVPVGAREPVDDSVAERNYAQYLAEHFPNSLRDGRYAPEAVSLYRSVLAGQPDHGVTIAAIGLQTNLAALLASGPDSRSRLTGRELVARKVARLVVMGGQYPAGAEFNFTQDPAATQRVVAAWPTRMIFDGFEIGDTVYTGAGLAGTAADNPVRAAYRIYVGEGNNRSSWDLTAVHYAIYGAPGLYRLSGPGNNDIATDGSNTWHDTPPKDQYYLVKTASDDTIAGELNQLLTRPRR
ncbi:nucleoside hydrolase [Kutzneria buriramensis]|nr:nucleoside hydrolase [Kutzneria buriramensis]